MNNAKPFYLSLTITGALVHLFITLAALFGVDLGDQADAIAKNIEQLTLAAGSLLATFSTIVGRIRASKQITLGHAPASSTPLLLLAAIAGSMALAGCAAVPGVSANGLPLAPSTAPAISSTPAVPSSTTSATKHARIG